MRANGTNTAVTAIELDPAQEVERRRLEHQAFELRANQASKLGDVAESMREDLRKLEARQAQFREMGAGHVTIPQESYHPEYHQTITWEPVRSLLTGVELAAQLNDQLAHLRDEIGKAEQEIARLLGEQ